MSVSQEVASTESGREHPDIVFADLLQRWQLSLVLVAFAILQQSLGHHNADNSWLFTVCEKLLDGAQPYVDVIETNPPASFMIYMPAVLLARMIGLPIEFVASVCVFSGVIACILQIGRAHV